MPFRAVLFDLDGTLLDTLEDLADSMNFCLRSVGASVHPTESYKHFVGDGVTVLAKRVLPADRRDEQTIGRLVAAMRARYAEHWADKTQPYEGIGSMLDALAARGLALTVLSNKADDFTKLMMAKFFPGRRFEAVAGARAGVPLKPDPAAALEIASELAIPPADFAYLGDTGTDMRTAIAAGMYPVGALWGFRQREELLEAGAKALVPNPGEFEQLLAEMAV